MSIGSVNAAAGVARNAGGDFVDAVRAALPPETADHDVLVVLSLLRKHEVTDISAFERLRRRAQLRDTARATTTGFIGFLGFSAAQLATAAMSHALGEHPIAPIAPYAGDALFCYLSSAIGDTIADGKLGPKYHPARPPFPVGATAQERAAQAVSADRPWLMPAMFLAASNAVTYGLRLPVIPSAAVNVPCGLAGAAVAGYHGGTAARALERANKAHHSEPWLTPSSTNGPEAISRHIADLRQSGARAVLGYTGVVATAFRDYFWRGALAATMSPKLLATYLLTAPYASAGALEKAASMERYRASVGMLPSQSYNTLKWLLIGTSWGYRREAETAFSRGAFTHAAAKARVNRWVTYLAASVRHAEDKSSNEFGAEPLREIRISR